MTPRYQTRPYRHPEDLAAVLALVRGRAASRVGDYPSLADLRELLCRADIQANSRLWFADGADLAGYAFNDHYSDFSGISFEFAPQYADIGGEMIGWCVENFRQRRREQATQLQLSVAVEDSRRIELLEAHGFRQEDWSLVQMTRQLGASLSDPIPAPSLPQGFTVRSFRGEEEMDEWVALHREAFGTQGLTAEYRRTWMQVPGYTPALDLVAVAPDGTFAAYVGMPYDEINRRAIFEPVCTHPEHQRKGLASALMREALRRAQAMGAADVIVNTGDMVPANALYDSLGFTEAYKAYVWRKTWQG